MGELARQVAYSDADEAPSLYDSTPSSEGTAPERDTSDSSLPDGGQSRGVQRYKVQFTADQSYVDLLERARDLLQHEVFDRDLARVHRLALEALLEKLSKRKYAGRAAEQRAAEQRAAEQPSVEVPPVPMPDTVAPGAGGGVGQSRYIPAHVKRAVWARDGARCTFTDARGQRCRETTLLEFHHREAYAKGGPTSLSNLTLHCRSHNRLVAEAEFGQAFVDNRRHAAGRGRHATGQRDSMGEARRDGSA
jgi:hypothetical protein